MKRRERVLEDGNETIFSCLFLPFFPRFFLFVGPAAYMVCFVHCRDVYQVVTTTMFVWFMERYPPASCSVPSRRHWVGRWIISQPSLHVTHLTEQKKNFRPRERLPLKHKTLDYTSWCRLVARRESFSSATGSETKFLPTPQKLSGSRHPDAFHIFLSI